MLQIICVGAYMIASSFLGVYSMAVDTLFLCFCKYFALLSKSLLGQKITGTWGVNNTTVETREGFLRKNIVALFFF